MSADQHGEAAALLRDVGRAAERARRYRALADAVAAPSFDRALAIGSEIRRALRNDATAHDVVGAALAELRDLLRQCESGIADVQGSVPYRDAVACYRTGNVARTAPLAAALFTGVTVAETPPIRLFWPVPIAGERSNIHFVAPTTCAERILAVAADGLVCPTDPPDLGGDDSIRPVALTREHEPSESPVALLFEGGSIPGPLCRLEASSTVLLYADRWRAPFTVTCTEQVSDEWWSARPDAYGEYVHELRAILGRADVGFTTDA